MKQPTTIHPLNKSKGLVAKVNEAIDNIESGSRHVDSDWAYLEKVKRELESKKDLNSNLQKVLDKILDLCYAKDHD